MNKELDKAEEMYGHLIKIKEIYYGEEAESIVNPLKNLAIT